MALANHHPRRTDRTSCSSGSSGSVLETFNSTIRRAAPPRLRFAAELRHIVAAKRERSLSRFPARAGLRAAGRLAYPAVPTKRRAASIESRMPFAPAAEGLDWQAAGRGRDIPPAHT